MRREQGFALVEILVAVLVLAAGAIAVLGVVDASTRNTFRAEQTQVAINRAQRELEQIRQLAYTEVALTTTPAASSDPKDPRYRVNGSDFAVGWDGATPSDYAEMVVKGIGGVTDGSVSPGPTSFTSGDVSGKVYRYVVWRDDPSCQLVPNSTIDACPGPHDYRQVVVIVTLDDTAIASTRAYTEVQSNFSDPDDSTATSQRPGRRRALADRRAVLSLRYDLQQRDSTGHHAGPHRAPDLGNLRGPESREAGRPLPRTRRLTRTPTTRTSRRSTTTRPTSSRA